MSDQPEACLKQLELALSVNRKCTRASILQGEFAFKLGDPAAAIEHWKRVEQQNPVYLALIAGKLMEAYRQLGRAETGVALLRSYLEQYPSLDMLDAVFQEEISHGSAETAYTLVRDELRRNPTLLGLDKLLEAQLLTATVERRADLELMKNLIHGHTRRAAPKNLI